MSGPGAGRGSIGELDFGMGAPLSRFLRFPAPLSSPFPLTRAFACGGGADPRAGRARAVSGFAALAGFAGLRPSISLIAL